MVPDADLRDGTDRPLRDRVADALDAVETGETVELVGDEDLEVALYRHRIARSDVDLDWTVERDGDAWRFAVTKQNADGDDLPAFDVRDLPPQRRHEELLDLADELDPGDGFVLVNDHDPKPLYHELRSTRGDVFDWDYRRRDDDEWRVAIEKTAPAEDVDEDVITAFDVREIPKRERHPSIHHRYGMIPEGATMALVAPHEPEPLHREFRQQYGDTFTWDVVDREPGAVRVHITKERAAGGGAAEATCGCEGDDGGDGEGESADASAATIEVAAELDVRDRPPAQRHQAIFRSYEALDRGEGFVLVNDHDPKPLYHQFEAEAGDEFRWEYRQKEPGEFRVLIGKADST